MNYIILDFPKRNGFEFESWEFTAVGNTPRFKYYEYILSCFAEIKQPYMFGVHLNDNLAIKDNLIYVYYNDIYDSKYINTEWYFMDNDNEILIDGGKEEDIEKTVNKYLRKYKIRNILNS